MLFRVLRVVVAVIMLSMAFFSTKHNGVFPLPTDERGIKITSATCGSRVYTAFIVYDSIMEAMKTLRHLDQSGLDKDSIFGFKPKLYDTLAFSPPYYFHSLYKYNPLPQSTQEDLVIFTGDGKLVKVVYLPIINEIKYTMPNDRKYIDCVLEVEETPARNYHSGQSSYDSGQHR